MNYNLLVLLCVAFFLQVHVHSQSTTLPENGLTHDIIDRIDIIFGSDVFTSNANLNRKEVYKLAEKLTLTGNEFTPLTSWDLGYLLNDNNEWISEKSIEGDTMTISYVDSSRTFYKSVNTVSGERIKKARRDPFMKYFYKTPANFFEVETNDFILKLNPVANFSLGKAKDNSDIIFQNTRGLNLRAYIDKKVYVFTSILENQARFNDYHEARINRFGAIPGNGLYKSYNSGILDNLKGWDFLNAQAYAGFNISKSVGIELGHGRHQIGNGIRSMLLSNYSHNYFYLKFRTQVWKLHYQNIFAELAPISDIFNPGNTLLPKKYMANHYLAFKPGKNFELGLFEAVVFAREDHFELQYLNPVILYRSVEQFLDSPDNVLIGLNVKWNIQSRWQIFGQFVLDELKIKEFTSGSGWWGNKYGIQVGAKYIDVAGIDHLDAHLEFNTATPYTYSHRDTLSVNENYSLASYSHYNQPLAHPLGSNFREWIFKLNYRPTEKLFFQTRVIRASHGDDTPDKNWGGVIFTPHHSNRVSDYGNTTLQGERTDITLLGVDFSYWLFHNYFLDLNFLYRKSEGSLDLNDFDTIYLGGGLRINFGKRDIDY